MNPSTSRPATFDVHRVGHPRTIALWGVSILLAVLFVGSGIPKLSGAALDDFTRWGHPRWFMVALGFVEVGCAALVLVPRMAVLAAAAMAVILVGALWTVATHWDADAQRLPVTASAFALALIVAAARSSSSHLAWRRPRA